MGATVEDVSGKLIISKFPNAHALAKKVRACVIFLGASKICLLPALWACDVKNLLRRLIRGEKNCFPARTPLVVKVFTPFTCFFYSVIINYPSQSCHR